MDTHQVVARFGMERQALAVMDHPHIAKVYDAGATPEGRPYFVMELVRGIPISTYCDKHKLSTKQRLELFTAVCSAVQHAHQKGVIHRDLKPSNVLVTVKQNKAVPKIIDFGVAKATGHRLTDQTLFTETGQLIGTPEYMSPEQAEMSGLDIDTRTDIYSLGVMLYEILVGALPFESKTLRKAAFSEIQRIIREVDPPRASTRLSGLGEKGMVIADLRKTDVKSLRRIIKGDLDLILIKAMEKDRVRRYSSAAEMATDIERHLKDEPVSATPPRTFYRMKKYIRRHKLGVTAAAVIFLALVAGVIGTGIGLVKATSAEKQAKMEARTARQVSDFLVDLFEISDPSESKGNSVTAREILDKGAEDIRLELNEQPVTKARLLNTMGRVYLNLGLYSDSKSLLDESLSLRRQELGERSIEAAKSLDSLSLLYSRQAQYDKAQEASLEAVSYTHLRAHET